MMPEQTCGIPVAAREYQVRLAFLLIGGGGELVSPVEAVFWVACTLP